MVVCHLNLYRYSQRENNILYITKGIMLEPKNVQHNKSMLKKTVYEDLQQKDIIKALEEKDRQISILEFKLERLTKEHKEIMDHMNLGEQNAGDFFKNRFQESMEMVEYAIQSFQDINHNVKQLLLTLKTTVQKVDESMSEVQSLLGMMGGEKSSAFSSQFSESVGNLNMDFLEKLSTESEELIEQLTCICDVVNKNYNKIRRDYTRLDNKTKQSEKHLKEEILTLKTELIETRTEKEKAKKLLVENQKQKNDIMKKISMMIDSTKVSDLQKMQRQKLIQFVKKLLYRTSQLEKSKQDAIRQNKKIKQQDLKKYRQMLNEVKEVRELSRIEKSKRINNF